MKFYYLLIGLGVLLFTGCGQNTSKQSEANKKQEVTQEDKDLLAKANIFFKPLPTIAENENNKLTAEKIALGKKLYYDKRLSKNETISCNDCHNLETYGVDNLATSPGDGGENGDRNSPTVLNAALHFVQFWDGRSPDVEDQAGGPVLNPIEMGIPNEAFLIERLSAIEEYQTMYTLAFPEDEKPLTYLNTQNAIGAFERTLLTPSPFDNYLNGDVEVLNTDQRAGLKSFIETGCTTCHIGSLLGGNMYHKFGLYDDYWKHTKSEKIDEGRFTETGNEGDKFMFKVPSLRNVEKTFPYYHDGSVESMSDAIQIMAVTQLNKELTDLELKNIGEFLKSLTGEIPKEALN